MILNFTNSSGNKLSVNIIKQGYDSDWNSIMSSEDRNFKFEFTNDDQFFTGTAIRGDDALWVPYGAQVGLKIVAKNPKYQSLQDSLETVDAIKASDSVAFPTIHNAKILVDDVTGEEYLVIVMENMGQPRASVSVPQFIPAGDRGFMQQSLLVGPKTSTVITREITRLKLCPEDEWYKTINLINGKIVDFHRFKINI